MDVEGGDFGHTTLINSEQSSVKIDVKKGGLLYCFICYYY